MNSPTILSAKQIINAIQTLGFDNWFKDKVDLNFFRCINTMINYFKFSPVILFCLLMFNTSFLLHSQTDKPDLIITNVELKFERPNHPHIPGEPVSGSDNLPQPNFYVTVSNYGHKDFSDPFYIAYTSNERAIIKGYYSGFSIVNQEQRTIGIKDSIVVRVSMLSPNYRYCKFRIVSDGKYSKDTYLPIIEEENYDNNSFECSFE